MKLLVTLCLMATLATVAWASSVSWGRRWNNDTLIYSENFVRRPERNRIHSINVDFPKPWQYNNKIITAIYAIDNFRNNSGALATLLSGGPNYKSASINLKSLYGKGFNTTIKMFGR